MKRKYYMRGLGVGIIITTLIFVVLLAVDGNQMTNTQIEEAARALGMEYPDESDTLTSSDDDEDEATEDEDTANSTVDVNADSDLGETVLVTVASGDSSSTVATKLEEAGVIDSADDFDAYLNAYNYDNLIQPGDFTITKGLSFEEIATILMTKAE